MNSLGESLKAAVAAMVFGTVLLASTAGSASATDFCLDLGDLACPPGASFQANLQTAMETDGNDGIPDRIFVPAGTTPAASNFSPNGTGLFDDLAVIGAGRDATILTSNGSGNVYVVDLNGISNRVVTMRDLTIRVPASFPDGPGYGAALQTNGDVFERVNFESRNPLNGSSGSGGATSILNGGTFRDIRFFGSEGGAFDRAFGTSSWFPGDSLEITGSDVRDFQSGVISSVTPGIPVHIERSRFTSGLSTVLGVYNADSSIENSVIEAGEYPPIQIGTDNGTSDEANLTFRNNTMLNVGGAETAIRVAAGNTAIGDAGVVVSDSIVFGFAKTWDLSAAAGAPGFGNANLDISYSNFDGTGSAAGDGGVSSTLGNISQTPLFENFTDFRLSAESPSIDAGDPAPGGILEDLAGTIRPLDGDGDGIAVRDQGAYEAPAIAPTCQTKPSICPPAGDTTPPVVSKLRSKRVPRKSKLFKLTYRLSEAARVRFTIKPVPARKNGRKRKTVTVSKRGRSGVNTLRVKKRRLKPGRYRVTVRPTDAAGNVGDPLKVKAVRTGGRSQRLNVQLN
ncbi:MAG TPA: hypothetical protein VMF31_10290 [Solirubrobacterales bacterium]|nr:hypothetical protein [Solirubrobacterales bacterium]